jgi:hypothetical protein
MDAALSESTREALRTAWILDSDTTVKLLYGHQAGAEIGYNPTKPGRPSHTLHTYWIGNLRLVLDVEVQGGKASCGQTQPAPPVSCCSIGSPPRNVPPWCAATTPLATRG